MISNNPTPNAQYNTNNWDWQQSPVTPAQKTKANSSGLSGKAIVLIAGISLACGLLGGLGGGVAYGTIVGGLTSSSNQQRMQIPGDQGGSDSDGHGGISGQGSMPGEDSGQSGNGSGSGNGGDSNSGNSDSSSGTSGYDGQSGANGQSDSIES